MTNKKNDKDDLFPGANKKLTADQTAQQSKKAKKTIFSLDLKEHKKRLSVFGSIDDDIEVEELSPKEVMLALDKKVATEFKIVYSPWQQKVFDTLYSVAGINIYKAGLEKKIKQIDSNISALMTDVKTRQKRVVGTVEFVTPTSIDDKAYQRAKQRIREKDKGLQFKLDELQFEASVLKKQYGLGEVQLSEYRMRLAEIDTALESIDADKDATAINKIEAYNRERVSIEHDKVKLEAMQNEYVARAKAYKAKMDGLSKQILREQNIIDEGRFAYVVSSSKADVLKLYIDDRNSSTPIPITIQNMKTVASDTGNMNSAIDEYDSFLEDGLAKVRSLAGLFDDSFHTSEVDKELESNLHRSNANNAEFMTDFASQYGL